jgi:amino acid transporter
LFTYGGWNEMAYVAAEVRNPRRNITRALVLGLASVTFLYLLLNTAFLHALGFHGVQHASAVATETVATAFPAAGAALVALLICVSALGATNGLIFTGARISYAMGRDHAWFRRLGQWHPRLGTPAAALVLQGAIAITLILLLGHFINAILYTAAVVYSFYAATTLAVVVLRRRDPTVERPFRVPAYPWTPLIFASVCLLLIRSAVSYKPAVAALALALLLVGVLLWRWQPRPSPETQ